MDWAVAFTCAIYLTVRGLAPGYGKPIKMFIRGFNGRNLPPGGWTHWFNVDHPGGAGDYETVDNIVRMYGRGCAGLPCRRPLAIKVASVYGLRPSEEGNRVNISPRRGLTCNKGHQHNHICADYRVRFYCPNLHIKCRYSRLYPHHQRQYLREMRLNATSVTLTSGNATQEMETTNLPELEVKVADKAGQLRHNEVNKNSTRRGRKWRKGSPHHYQSDQDLRELSDI